MQLPKFNVWIFGGRLHAQVYGRRFSYATVGAFRKSVSVMIRPAPKVLRPVLRAAILSLADQVLAGTEMGGFVTADKASPARRRRIASAATAPKKKTATKKKKTATKKKKTATKKKKTATKNSTTAQAAARRRYYARR
jgi:hypothetical protein